MTDYCYLRHIKKGGVKFKIFYYRGSRYMLKRQEI